MINKAFRALAVAIFVALTPQNAAAETIDDIVGSLTRLNAVDFHCYKYYKLNRDYLNRMQAALLLLADRQFPNQFSAKRFGAAAIRREKEVKAVGAKQWCTTWRGVMRRDGMTNVWP